MTGKRTALTVLIALALTLTSMRGAVAAPGMELDPSEGPVGTVVTATGTEFTGVEVELFFDSIGGTLLAISPISDGSFKLLFRVPSTTEGHHTVIACVDRNQRNTCREAANDFFTVSKPPTTTTTTTPTITTQGPPSTTTTTSSPIGVVTTTIPPFPPFPTGDDYTWTQDNPPPRTQGAFTVPTTTPPPSIAAPDALDPEDWPDLRVTAIEVTQGMQNMANDMPLVSNRRTFARVYINVIGEDTWAPIFGVLEVWRGNNRLGQLTPENPGISVQAGGGSRLDINDSLYFEIPLAWADGTSTRFSTLVWSFAPSTIDYEPAATNNVRHAFVDFFDAQPATVHPAPLHLHRSYHPTDEIRTYTAVFGGAVYTRGGGSTSGALDVIEGLWRYHPVSSVSLEPYPAILYPLDHHEGVEWNLGPCSTYYMGEAEAQINQPGWPSQPFESLWSWEPFFEDPGSIDPDDLEADFVEDTWGQWGLVPDRTSLAVMDRRYDVSRIYIEKTTGKVGFSRTQTPESTGPAPVPGAPAFVGGCSRPDSHYSAPNQVMGLNRVWYDWDNETEYFLGMVDPSLPTRWGGLASSGYDAAWAKFSQTTGQDQPWDHSGARLVGHELGHLTGLKHAPCRDSDGDGIPDELAGGALDLTHPSVDWFPDCQLGEIELDGFYGFDVYYELFGLGEPAVISPDPASPAGNRAFPLMGYRGPKWTDPYHWCRMLTHYGVTCSPNLVGITWNPPPPGATEGAFSGTLPQMPAPGSNYEVAIITGTLPNPAGDDDEPSLPGVNIFSDINVIPGCHDCSIKSLTGEVPPLAPESPPAVPWIEVWGRDGTLIQRTPIDVELQHDDHGHIGFQAAVVFEPGATIRVVDSDGTPLGETRADTVPIELVTLSLTSVDTQTGLILLEGPWDSLPDETTHVLQYSADGAHWLTLAARRDAPITQVDPGVFDRLPGSTAGQTRILLSTGWAGGSVDGPNIGIPNKAPVIMLQLPLDQAAYALNELVEMSASALDPEDRDLTDHIEWESSLDGPLGTGPSVATWTLSAGEHTMTASVTDSAGLTSRRNVSIVVSGQVVQAVLSDADRQIIALHLTAPEDGPGQPPTTVADTSAQPEAPGDEGGGGFPAVPVVIVVLAVLGGGVFWRSRGGLGGSRP